MAEETAEESNRARNLYIKNKFYVCLTTDVIIRIEHYDVMYVFCMFVYDAIKSI